MQYSYGAQPNSDFISCSEYQPSSLVSLTEFLFRIVFFHDINELGLVWATTGKDYYREESEKDSRIWLGIYLVGMISWLEFQILMFDQNNLDLQASSIGTAN